MIGNDGRELVGGRFRLLDQIGSGGMATVWLAQDTRLDRPVALKRLHPSLPASAAARFTREARAAAALSHPHVVTVFDTDEDDEGPYLVMEYVEGRTLARELEDRGPIEPEEAVRLARICAEALAHAHDRGVIHRDVKPRNVLLGADGTVKLADFGIAKVAWEAEGEDLTGTTAILGTAAYLSPEQASGQETTFSSDLYSLGVVLYQMLTGRVPFSEDHPVATALAHTIRAPEPPNAIRPVPAALDSVVMRCLEKDPDLRPSGAKVLADELRVLERGGVTMMVGNDSRTAPLSPASSGDTLVMAVPDRTRHPSEAMDAAAVGTTGSGVATIDRGPGPRRLAVVGLLLAIGVALGAVLVSRLEGGGLAPPVTTVAASPTTTIPATTIPATTIPATTVHTMDEDTPATFDEALDLLSGDLQDVQQGRDLHPGLKRDLEEQLSKVAREWSDKREVDKANDGLEKFIETVAKGREEGRVITSAADRLIQASLIAVSLLPAED